MAGDGINDEYNTIKAEGGRSVAKGVVLTNAGDLSRARYIMHLMVNGNPVKLRETLDTALRLAEKRHLKSISFPPLPHQLHSLSNKLFECIDDFIKRDQPICLHFIQLVVRDSARFCQYANTRQRITFEKYREILVTTHPLFMKMGAGLHFGSERTSMPPATEITAQRHCLFPDEIHVQVNNVCLHVKQSGDFYTKANSTIACITFREASWFSDCFATSVQTTFQDIQTTEDTTYRRIGNHLLFEIAIDNNPGKFIRLKSVIQAVLRYADEYGIKQVLFPLYFRYGNHQMEFELEFDKIYRDSSVIPLLYFQAISDYALSSRPCNLHNMHIYILPERDTNDRDLINALQRPLTSYQRGNLNNFQRVRNQRPFRSIFTTMQIDSLFQACHLSVVHETIREKRRRWIWSNYCKKYKLREIGTLGAPKRYTYNLTIGNILPVEVPMEILLER